MCLHFAVRLIRWASTGILLVLLSAAALAAGSSKVKLRLAAQGEALLRGGQTAVEVISEVDRGWHINAHQPTETFLIPTEVRLNLPAGVFAEALTYPTAEWKTFAFAGGKELLVYQGRFSIATELHVPRELQQDTLRIEAVMRYQACNDSACLPPATASADLVLPVSTVQETSEAGAPAAPVARQESRPASNTFDVAGWMAHHGLGVTLLFVALLGLGLNLTPCVYPLISVTVAYFGTQGRQRDTYVALLAAVYVVGITLTFAVLGVAAALSGGIFGAVLQKGPVLLLIATVLVMLALSSFGLYQLQPPAWMLRYVSGSAQGLFGSFFMGLTMGVVAAPCVGPVVLGLLLLVSSQQDAVLGLQMFAALGLGMGLPYLALATLAGSIRSLPRSGEWLVWVEHFFGVMLLALAAYFIAPLLPKSAANLLAPSLAAAGGVYLGFIDRSGGSLRHFPLFKRVAGGTMVLVALWIVVPHRSQRAIAWRTFEIGALEAARQSGRPAMVDFLADWCVPCREMDRTTFVSSQVQELAERFVMFKADITNDADGVDALVQHYDVRGVPTLLIFDSSGKEVQRLVGYVGPQELIGAMRNVY